MTAKQRVVFDDDGEVIEGMDYLIALAHAPDHYVEIDFVNPPPEVVRELRRTMTDREKKS